MGGYSLCQGCSEGTSCGVSGVPRKQQAVHMTCQMHNTKAVASLTSRQDDMFQAKCEDSRYVQCQPAGSWVRCGRQSLFCEQSHEHFLIQHFAIWLSSRFLLIQRNSACREVISSFFLVSICGDPGQQF